MWLTRLLTLRSLSTRRLRTMLTVAGIALGVAAIFAINATNHQAYSSIARLFAGTTGQVSLEIQSNTRTGSIPQELLPAVKRVVGVSEAAPVLRLPAVLPGDMPASVDITFLGASTGGLVLHGVDPEVEVRVRDYTLTQGRFLESSPPRAQIVLVEDFADEHGLELGKDLTLVTARGPVELEVVGYIARTGAGLTNLGKFGLIELGQAQLLTGRTGEVDRIDVVAEKEVHSNPNLLSTLQLDLLVALGSTYSITYPANQGDRVAQMLSGYQIGLNFMAGIALFVGVFLIYNSFSMTVMERTRELGLLRSLGMSRQQIMGQVLQEGLLLGLSGAILGASLGIGLTRGLLRIMSGVVGQTLDLGHVSLPILLGSMTVGMAVSMMASLLPAYQAGRISPLEALRLRGRPEQSWFLRYGWIPGVFLLVSTTAVLVWNPLPYDVQFRLGSLTVFALFSGAMFILPVTLGFWQQVWRWLLGWAFGRIGDLGIRNLERARLRTMLTCGALLVGVSMIVVIQGMTGAFTRDLYLWMDAYIGGDVFVGASVPVDRQLQVVFEELTAVEAATPIRYLEVTWYPKDGIEEIITFMAVDPSSYVTVTRFVFSDPDTSPEKAMSQLEQGDTVFISSVVAERYGLEAGDTVSMETRGGPHNFRIAAVVLDFFNQGLVITGSWSDVEQYLGVTEATTFLVKASSDASADDVIHQLSQEYQETYQLLVESNQVIKERALSLMNQAFRLFDVLGVLAVLVAALGVVNTLSMAVAERTREIGMLRSIGMGRWQVVQMILAEAGLLGLIGGLLGMGFGLALTRIFLTAMTAMSGYALAFVIPWRALILSLVVALVTSQIAAAEPASRAARTPLLEAIHYE